MKIVFLLLLQLFLLYNAFPQNVQKETDHAPALLKRFELGTSLNQYDELSIDAKVSYQEKQGQFAIRVCSDSPFIIAGKSATGNISYIIFRFNRDLKVPTSKILLLRSNDCLSKSENVVATEVWWVPGKTFPAYKEKYEPCQFNNLLLGEDPRDDAEYSESLLKLRKTISISHAQGRKVAGFVTGFYSRVPNKLILRRLQKARRLLADEIRGGLIVIRTEKNKNADLENQEDNAFIEIAASEIKDKCEE